MQICNYMYWMQFMQFLQFYRVVKELIEVHFLYETLPPLNRDVYEECHTPWTQKTVTPITEQFDMSARRLSVSKQSLQTLYPSSLFFLVAIKGSVQMTTFPCTTCCLLLVLVMKYYSLDARKYLINK
jgi:hypothetical protein